MQFTPEQTLESTTVDLEQQLSSARSVAALQLASNLILENKRARIEAVRLAKETLVENSRSKPVDSREVTAEEIKNFAEVLTDYMSQ